LKWLGLSAGKFYDWRQRYGRTNQHNGWVPRDFWLQEWEKKAILDFQQQYPLEGYRRLTYLMMDVDVVAVSPSSVFRVLSEAGRLQRWAHKASKKGTGFEQPLKPHEHWHIDIAHINIHGTFLLLMRGAGWGQPLPGGVEPARINDRSRCGDPSRAPQGAIPPGTPADHFR
jgi:hypothetical protein